MKTMNYKKTEHFEPIAMKCTRKQFKRIEPILKQFGKIGHLIGAFNKYNYLTNNYDVNMTFDLIRKEWYDYKTHETFNAETFLKACGIVSEPLYQLTAKEVVHAYENPQYLKDTFKECFVPEYTITEAEEKFNIKIKAV